MKVIDLLNKIANKEEIPLIKYNGRILHYDYLNEWFEDKKDNGYCKMEVYYEDLNDEVEILDNKKIEERLPIFEDGDTFDTRLALNQERRMINKILDHINKEEE